MGIDLWGDANDALGLHLLRDLDHQTPRMVEGTAILRSRHLLYVSSVFIRMIRMKSHGVRKMVSPKRT